MKHGRKISGGRYKKARKKKLYELPGQRRMVALGREKRKSQRGMGGHRKTYLLKANIVNVRVGNKVQKLEIKNVAETPANRFLARQNVITKGTIVQTDQGKVRITNRPGQEGLLNGVLVE